MNLHVSVLLLLLAFVSVTEARATVFAPMSQTRYQELRADRQAAYRAADSAFVRAFDAYKLRDAAYDTAIARLDAARISFDVATDALARGESDLDTLRATWRELTTAAEAVLAARSTFLDALDIALSASRSLTTARLAFAQLENDYEAQSRPSAVRDRLAACRSTDCPALSRATGRLAFQPSLETINAPHAYARGLTGEGVRIGIDDSPVNYWLPELRPRISFSGAQLTYPVYLPASESYSVRRCMSWPDASGCYVESQPLGHARDSFTADLINSVARAMVAVHGWPTEDERWLIHNRTDDSWHEVPAPDSHGTEVASVAAGRDFGVAPGATIVPIARDFTGRATFDELVADFARGLHSDDRAYFDALLAADVARTYAGVDILNRSFGIHADADVRRLLEGDGQWWGEGLRRLLPQYWRAHMQTSTPPSKRTIVVYAAGNETSRHGGLGADIPYHVPHVRGTQVAVMALGFDGLHAGYTNFCGGLPPDWDASRWGRHYCLAAPGTVNAAGHRGAGDTPSLDVEGTSFAAPLVSGGLALLMEHFRGQLGNDRIVRRLIDTADNSGLYESLEIYGAGVMDLEAALAPVGRVTTGTATVQSDIALTRIVTPAAFGSLATRFGDAGVEIAGLDAWGAPFWRPPGQVFASLASHSPLIPGFVAPDPDEHDTAAEHDAVRSAAPLSAAPLHLGFTPDTHAASFAPGYAFLAGEQRFGIEYARAGGWRWGALADRGGWLGGRASGAFGEETRALTSWVGRDLDLDLGREWRLRGHATLAYGMVSLAAGAMLDVAPALLSAWSLGVEHGGRGGPRWSRLALSQPLRAETGRAVLTWLSGLSDGEPAYRSTRVPLAPEGRMLELALGHEREVAAGRVAVELALALDPDHRDASPRSRFGLRYRLDW